jgi:mRNA-degrading endonuclease RelE of RelBE toxin-antitoxin system
MEICLEPHKFKPLNAPMQGQRRVHIGSFAPTYSINEATRTVTVEDYAHHDVVYE